MLELSRIMTTFLMNVWLARISIILQTELTRHGSETLNFLKENNTSMNFYHENVKRKGKGQ